MKYFLLLGYIAKSYVALLCIPIPSFAQEIVAPNEYRFNYSMDIEMRLRSTQETDFTALTRVHYNPQMGTSLLRIIRLSQLGKPIEFNPGKQCAIVDAVQKFSIRIAEPTGLKADLYPFPDSLSKESLNFKVTKSDETQIIQGYTCRKVTYTYATGIWLLFGKVDQIVFWVNDSIPKPNYFPWYFPPGGKGTFNEGHYLDFPTEFPLKIMVSRNLDRPYTMTLEVLKIREDDPYTFDLKETEVLKK